MKSISIFLLPLVLASTAAAAEKKCSEENLLKLVKITGSMLGEAGYKQIKCTELLSGSKYKDFSLEQLRKIHHEIEDKKAKSTGEILNQLASLLKTNPECDIDGMFTVKK